MIAALLAAAALASPHEVRAAMEAMGTTFTVVLPRTDEDAARAPLDAAFAEIARADEVMNEWRPDSPLSALNADAGRWVALPPDLLAVLDVARDVARRSDGAFDPTWAALRGLWRFDASAALPDAGAVAERARLVRWRGLAVDERRGRARLKREGMAVGLGGIAKGWALDRAAVALRGAGYADFLLDAGGQIYAAGHPEPGRGWVVGLRDPRGDDGDWFATIEVSDASVSTSGDYERFFEADGQRWHHLLDPDTGWPARGVRSAIVVAPDATAADAWSTALFVLGVERGLDLAGAEGLDVVYVDDAGAVHASEGTGLTLRHPPAR